MATLALNTLATLRRTSAQLKKLKRQRQDPPEIEARDVQGIVFRGYGRLPCANYTLLQVRDPVEARGWLAQMADQVTSGEKRPEHSAAQVAFTYAGLAALGLPQSALAGFSREFIGTMVGPDRSRFLGDVGGSAPERWGWGGPNTPIVHVLVMTFADSEARLKAEQERLSQAWTQQGLRSVLTLHSLLLAGREHFGFRDGVSQPAIEGYHQSESRLHRVRAGEFILGYPNEYELYTDRPLVPSEQDPEALLAEDVEGGSQRDFGRNGTYLVMRQLRQDVPAFRAALEDLSRNPDGSSNIAQRDRLAAQIVGRWPSGAPLVTNPWRDDPSQRSANEFAYHREDREGLLCPIGAHVRRSNPRDALAPDPGTDASLAINRRHRLLRRGRPYGSPLAPGHVDQIDRGMVFIGLNANIARQFEFIQHSWLQDTRFNGLFGEADPLVGTQQRRCFSAPEHPVSRRYEGLPAFVTTVGGAYFFLPAVRALRFLGRLSG